MIDPQEVICNELEKTRSAIGDVLRKLEEVCESPESCKYKFLAKERQCLMEQESELLQQRLQLWKLMLSRKDEKIDDMDDNCLVYEGFAYFAIICLFIVICVQFLTVRPKFKFMEL